MSASNDMVRKKTATRTGVLVLACIAVAGCTGDRIFGNTPEPDVAAAPLARPAVPPVTMAGRWMLSSAGRQCGMTFGGGAGASEGTIAPEGGCPGQFFTSRKWTFDSSGLIVRNHNGEPLAQLSGGDGGRFEGKATRGDAVTLTR